MLLRHCMGPSIVYSYQNKTLNNLYINFLFLPFSSTRSFNVYSANVGKPLKISIRKDTHGFISTDWFLEKVSSCYFYSLTRGQKEKKHDKGAFS